MNKLILAFLKMFYRNPRAMFFVLFLPSGLFLFLSFFGQNGVIDFKTKISYDLFLLPGMIVYTIMQSSVYSSTYALIDQKRTKILQKLSLTPLRPRQFLVAQYVARFVIAVAQASILLIFSVVLFGRGFDLNILILPVCIFLSTVIFLNFGFLIVAIARDYEEAAPYTLLVSLPLSFFGNVFFPLANLPDIFVYLGNLLPIAPLVALTSYSLGIVPEFALLDILIILAWFIVSSICAQTIFAKKVYI